MTTLEMLSLITQRDKRLKHLIQRLRYQQFRKEVYLHKVGDSPESSEETALRASINRKALETFHKQTEKLIERAESMDDLSWLENSKENRPEWYINEIAALHNLLDCPNSEEMWWYLFSQLESDFLLLGQIFLWVIRDSNKEPYEVYRLDPKNVIKMRIKDRESYKLYNEDKSLLDLPLEDVICVRREVAYSDHSDS
jgi:hypothetical protein